jgi:hypothetical protein
VTSRALNSVLAVLCAAGVAWAAVLIGGLLAGEQFVPRGVPVPVAAALIVPGFVAGMVTNRTAFRKVPRPRRMAAFWTPTGVPQSARVAAGVLFAAFWIAAVTALFGLSETGCGAGSCARDAAAEQRFALGVLGALGVGGALLTASTAARSRLGERAAV